MESDISKETKPADQTDPEETSPATDNVTEQVDHPDDKTVEGTDTSEAPSHDSVIPTVDKPEDLGPTVDPEVVEKLTTGVVGLFLPNLQQAKGSLNGVLHNQEVLIESIQQENAKFKESVSLKNLVETMQKAKVYHAKLIQLKREMTSLTDKSAKLKKRAVKLQQQKEKEVRTRREQKDKELAREQMLAAKIAAPAASKQASKQ